MFNLSSSQKFYLYSESTDMRKSFDGLSGLILTAFDQVPTSSSVFILCLSASFPNIFVVFS